MADYIADVSESVTLLEQLAVTRGGIVISSQSDRLRVPSSAFPASPTAYTIGVCFKQTSTRSGQYCVILAVETGPGHSTEWNELLIAPDGESLQLYDDVTGEVDELGTITNDVWYEAFLSVDTGGAYLAGFREVGASSWTTVSGTLAPVSVIDTIGFGMSTFTTEWFAGALALAYLYDFAFDLDDADAQGGSPTAVHSSLLGFWALENTTNFREDTSGNDDDLTTLGEGAWEFDAGPVMTDTQPPTEYAEDLAEEVEIDEALAALLTQGAALSETVALSDAVSVGGTTTQSASASESVSLSEALGVVASNDVSEIVLGTAFTNSKYPDRTSAADTLTYGVDFAADNGFECVKLYLSPAYATDYPGQAWETTHTSLLSLVQDAAFEAVLGDSRVTTVVLNVWTFANGLNNDWVNAQPLDQLTDEYDELRDLCEHLLTTYANKTFIVQNWEGDWALLGAFDPEAPEDSWRPARMAAFLRARQRAVVDARAAVASSSRLIHAVEVNRALDTIGYRVHRDVAPRVRLDAISLSAYEAVNAFVGAASQGAAEDAIEARLRELVADVRRHNPGVPIYVGEFGFPQDEASMTGFDVGGFLDRILSVSDELGLTHLVWWQLFDNEEQSPGVPRGYGLFDRDADEATPGARNAAGDWFVTELS